MGDGNVEVDLLSILTHEAGHFLGLSDSRDTSATMFPAYSNGTTDRRHISTDDIAGICSAYPPGAAITGCNPTPPNGFSSKCGVSAEVDASTSRPDAGALPDAGPDASRDGSPDAGVPHTGKKSTHGGGCTTVGHAERSATGVGCVLVAGLAVCARIRRRRRAK